MNKAEREKLREHANRFSIGRERDFPCFTSPEVIALLDHIDALEGQVENLQDKEGRPTSISFWFMHDGHWFTRLQGATLDEILAHADAVELSEDGSYGALCPATLKRGDKEIRRVGPMVHARGSSHPKDQWMIGKAEWKAALSADPDVQRILGAAIAGASEE
jgi:hypothetical protein